MRTAHVDIGAVQKRVNRESLENNIKCYEGESANMNPPVVVSRKWPGGLPLPGRSLLENGRGGWGGSPPGGRPILVTFNGDFPCSSLLFYAFLCFLAAGKAASFHNLKFSRFYRF